MGLFSRNADIGDLKSRRDFEGLADVLKKNDDEQRRQAVEAIAELNDPAAVAPVIEMASRLRTRAESYESAQEAIQRLGPVAVEPLAALIRSEGSLGASSQLARLGEPLALEPLRALTREADPDCRDAALWGLNELSTPAAVAVLAEAAESGPGRRRAIEVMKQNSSCAGDPRAVRAVIAALDDEDDELRSEAGQTLTRMAQRLREGEVDAGAVRTELVAATGRGALRTRLGAVMALDGSIPEEAPLPDELGETFVAACSDEEPGVQAFAALALAKRGDRRGFDTLVAVLPSENAIIAGAGATGLKLLGDPAALPAIRARLDAESDKSTPLTRELVHARNDLKGEEKKLAKG